MVASVAFSPDGKHLAIMLETGDLLLHDIVTSRTDTLNKGDEMDRRNRGGLTSPFLRQATF